MIVLVTGSRDYQNRLELYEILRRIYEHYNQIAIVVGDCPTGADLFAREWAESTKGEVYLRVFDADWRRKCDENCYHRSGFKYIDGILVPYCPRAGHLRNQEMVDFITDLRVEYSKVICLAFYKFGSANKGTSDCVRRARKARIQVKKVWQHG